MQGKKVMGKGLAKIEKHGVMSAGTPGAKKTIAGKVGTSNPTKAGKSDTATSKKAQPSAFTGVAAPRAAGFTRFVN